MTAPGEFVIADRAAVSRLRTDRGLKRATRRIRIDPDVDIEGGEALERKINKSYFGCGCTSGALAVYAAIGFVSATWVFFPEIVGWTWWSAVFVVLAAALGGKVVGITVNRARSAHLLDHLERAFDLRTELSHRR